MIVPPSDGLQRNTLQLLEALAKHEEGCDLIAMHSSATIGPVPAGVHLLQAHRRGPIPSELRRIFTAKLLRRPDPFGDAIDAAVRTDRYGVLLFEGLAVMPYLRRESDPPQVFNLIDPASRRNWRMANFKFSLRSVRHYLMAAIGYAMERYYLRRARRVVVVSGEDERYLQTRLKLAQAVSVPVFGPPVRGVVPPVDLGDAPGALLLADLRFPHLAESVDVFCRGVLPLLDGITVTLLAKGAQARQAAGALPAKLTCLDWVDDFEALVRSARVVVAPDLVGTGIKNRVIHAMLLGVPVVGTTQAFEGIHIESDVHAITCDSPASMADAIRRLLSEPALRRAIGDAGKSFAQLNYSDAIVGDRWRTILERVQRPRPAG